MPSPLTQNRHQLVARQEQIAAQTTAPINQARQTRQAESTSNLEGKDLQTGARRQDFVAQHNQRATETRLRLSNVTRTADNDSLAEKVAANRKDVLAYLQTQTQHKLMSAPLILGYA